MIIIIAVLAAIAIPKAADAVQRDRNATNTEQLRLLSDAITRFHTDTGTYPASLNDLLSNPTSPPANGVDRDGNPKAITAIDYHGPYLDRAMVDPYASQPYDYSLTPPTVGTVALSAGSGGVTALGGPQVTGTAN